MGPAMPRLAGQGYPAGAGRERWLPVSESARRPARGAAAGGIRVPVAATALPPGLPAPGLVSVGIARADGHRRHVPHFMHWQ